MSEVNFEEPLFGYRPEEEVQEFVHPHDPVLVYRYPDGTMVGASIEHHQDVEFKTRQIRRINRLSKPFTKEELETWDAVMNAPVYPGVILTDNPTEQEMAEWRAADEFLKTVDTEAVKKKYNIKLETDPYQSKPYEIFDFYEFEAHSTPIKAAWAWNKEKQTLEKVG